MRAAMSNRRSRVAVAGAGAVALALVASSAEAVVQAGEDATALAAAMSATTVTGAALSVDYECEADDPATPEDESLCPTGVGTTPLAGFPTHGSTYTVITSGDAALADDPNDDVGSGWDWGVEATPIGSGVYDWQVLRVDLGAATGNCLAFDFKFMSEEYPEFVSSGYNDAFIAQLNTWGVTADPATQTVTAPGNFAAGAGDVISVDGAGPSAMGAAQAAGTTYDGSTLPLIARTPVAPGSTNSLYLTIFDQGDGILDSAALVDNVRYETLAAGQCKSLAVDPFEGSTGVVVAPGTTGSFSPTLSTFTVPLVSNLPTGPIPTTVNGAASFYNWGDVVPRRNARAAQVTTPLGTGSLTIPAGGSGNLVITNTPAGIAAVQAAKAQPAALLAQAQKATQLAKKYVKKAKKLVKKAKKLKKQAATAPPAQAAKLLKQAKKLLKKAKKLKKKAKKLKRQAATLTATSKTLAAQPLGTVVVTLTNPANGKSELLRFQIPR